MEVIFFAYQVLLMVTRDVFIYISKDLLSIQLLKYLRLRVFIRIRVTWRIYSVHESASSWERKVSFHPSCVRAHCSHPAGGPRCSPPSLLALTSSSPLPSLLPSAPCVPTEPTSPLRLLPSSGPCRALTEMALQVPGLLTLSQDPQGAGSRVRLCVLYIPVLQTQE